MRFSFIEVVLVLTILLLCFISFNQKQRVDSLYETLDLQHEAITKQKLLINMQATRIRSMENSKYKSIRPNFL
jgi:hypothetical protein